MLYAIISEDIENSVESRMGTGQDQSALLT